MRAIFACAAVNTALTAARGQQRREQMASRPPEMTASDVDADARAGLVVDALDVEPDRQQERDARHGRKCSGPGEARDENACPTPPCPSAGRRTR